MALARCAARGGRSRTPVALVSAVALAWQTLAPSAGCFLAKAIGHLGVRDPIAARLIHQASFMHLSLLRRATMGWEAAGRWLVRASGSRCYRIWAGLDGDGGHEDPDDLDVQAHAGADLDYPAWEYGVGQECNVC